MYGSLHRAPAIIDGQAQPIGYSLVDAHFFETVQLPILKGRLFSETEAENAAPVAVVSEGTARRLWPKDEAIGKRFRIPGEVAGEVFRAGTYEVIGIVPDTSMGWVPDGRDPTSVYLPTRAGDSRNGGLMVRLRNDARLSLDKLEHACRTAGMTCEPIARQDVYAMQMFPFEAAATVSATLGCVAVLLTAIGLYGVVSYLSTQRTHEVGIRLAFGATRHDIVNLFLAQSTARLSVGLALGVTISLVLSKVSTSFLSMMNTFDLVVYVGVPIFLATVHVLATWVPAWRAALTDPMRALRYE